MGWRELAAPEGLRETPTHLELADGRVCCTLAVVGYPREVSLNWLEALFAQRGEYRLAQHIEPVDSASALRELDRDLRQSTASLMLAQATGRSPDAEDDSAARDAQALRAELARGEVRLFRAHLLLTIFARERQELERRRKEAVALLEGQMLTVRQCLWEQAPGFAATLPLGNCALPVPRNLDSRALLASLALGGTDFALSQGEVWGVDLRRHSLVTVDRRRLPNGHILCLAASGAGKSFWMKNLLSQAALCGRVVVLDPTGEYGGWCSALGGRSVRLDGEGTESLNPLARPPHVPHARWLAEWEERLSGLLALLGGPDVPPPAAVLRQALQEVFCGTGPRSLGEVAGVLGRQGPSSRVAARTLREALGGGLRSFAGERPLSAHRQPQVFDLRATAAQLPAVSSAALMLLAHHVVDHLAVPGRDAPLTLAVDEAHHLLEHPATARLLEVMLRTGRKNGVSVLLATQSLGDLSGAGGSPQAARATRAALTNAATVLLLRQQNAREVAQLREMYGLGQRQAEWLLNCPVGEGLVLAGARRAMVRILAPDCLHPLFRTDPPEPPTGAPP